MKDVRNTHRRVNFRAVISTVTAMALLFTSVLSGFGEIKAKAADVTVITTQAQLAAIANNLGGNYELGCDINLTGTWTPIGAPSIDSGHYNASSGFTGVFNGKGHKITGMNVNYSSGNVYATGLFANTYNATIENVSVYGSVYNCNNDRVLGPFHDSDNMSSFNGGLVGCAFQTTIKNCYSGVTVRVPGNTHSYIGGLAGTSYKGKVLNCSAGGSVDDQSDTTTIMAGGLIGEAASELIYNCFAFGSVNAGGELIGRTFDPSGSTCTVSSCYALNVATAIRSANTTATAECTSLSADDMKAASFVDKLNTGITSHTTDTGLISWSTDSLNANSGYPVYKTLNAADNLGWDRPYNFVALWDMVPGATSYIVKLYKSGTTGAVDTETVTDATCDFTSKVTETGAYSFTVTALGDGTNAYDASESSASSPQTYLKPLSAPTALAWDTGTPGKATWSAVTGAVNYTVWLMKSGKVQDTETVAAGTTSFDFTGKLTYTGSYTFYVRANGDKTTADDSAEVGSAAYSYTNPIPAVAVPSGLAWDTAIPGKATWGAVTGATSYTVYLYRSGSTSVFDTETVGSGTTEYDFTGKITAGSSRAYTFTVLAKGDGTTTSDSEESSPSAEYNYMKPLAAPTDLAWDTTIPGKARWGAVNGAIGYIVKLYRSGTTDAVDTETTGTPVNCDFTNKITVTGSYTFTVITRGNNSSSSNSPESSPSAAYSYTAPTPTATVDSVTVSPSTASVEKGGSQTFSATVTGSNSPAQTVTWTVTGKSSANTKIGNDGKLTVGTDENTGTTLTVTATSTVDTGKSGTATVTVAVSAPTVSSVTVSPSTASVEKGGSQTFSASVSGTNSPAQTVTWSVSGNNSANTQIGTDGKLTVGADEIADSLTVTATSTVDGTKSGTATVTVTPLPAPTVTSVSVSPSTASVAKGESKIFGATVTGSNSPAQTVTWGVSGQHSSGTAIGSDGKLTVGADETAATLTVTATSTVDATKFGTATVTVTTTPPPTPTVSSVTVSPSAPLVAKGGSQTFSATVTGSNSPDQSVTWSITGNSSSNTKIGTDGKLTVGADETAITVTVTATSTVDATKSGSVTVAVAPPIPVVLQSIAITKPASKLVYTVGDPLDLSGLEVTGTYSDKSTKVESITEANITGFDSSKPASSQRLTVTVGGKKATFTVEISAKEEPGSGIISAFSSLADSVKTQTVTLGTAISTLPQKLKAVVDGISNTFVSVAQWVSNITYNPNAAGTYDFTPVLDSGYQLKDSGVQLPHITVKVVAGGGSSSTKSSSEKPVPSSSTQTEINTAGNTAVVSTVADSTAVNGNTAEIAATVPSVNTDTGTSASLDPGKKASVEIDLPKDSILQQLAAKRDVALTVTVPSDVAANRNANLAVDIKVDSEILAAAQAAQSDVTVSVRDAGTQQLAYSWTFKGEDLAKSTVPVTNVNIAMSVRTTAEVPQVGAAAPNHSGVVLSFEHSGVLPAAASVRISVTGKGYKPGQTLYFYYYNPATQRIESLDNSAYTVDADDYVTVKISHCSDYVLLPQAARFLTLDTRSYTMAPNGSYEIGVKRTGADGTALRAYSSAQGAADVTELKNGNVKVTGVKAGLTYIMIDVYDSKNKRLTHASVRLNVQNGVKPSGSSQRQYGTF